MHRFTCLRSTPPSAGSTGQAYRYLQKNGALIGGNDLWIAATALAYRMPVVTSNVQHYGRVPGLQVADYRAEGS